MVTRVTPFGRLTFDRDAIVRAALRAHVEDAVAQLPNRLGIHSVDQGVWTGNLQRGTLYNDNGSGDYEVIAWIEGGVVGLAHELGWGPISQLGLTPETVTGGVEDVRGAVPGLPDELEPAFLMAAGKLETRADVQNGVFYRERMAGVGFWLHSDCVGGSFFVDRMANGADRLAAWGSLEGNRLPGVWCGQVQPFTPDPPLIVPIQAVIDAVTDRAWKGPTEFTPDELATICPTPPEPKRLEYARYRLQQVGVRWPGLPDVLEEPLYPG